MSEAPNLKRRAFLLGRLTEVEHALPPPVAVISPSCLAFHGVACMSCRDVCPSGAVRFELALGGARPRIEADLCTVCGDCARACPADAVRMPSLERTS